MKIAVILRFNNGPDETKYYDNTDRKECWDEMLKLLSEDHIKSLEIKKREENGNSNTTN